MVGTRARFRAPHFLQILGEARWVQILDICIKVEMEISKVP